MGYVLVTGIDRPALAPLLARRGLTTVADPGAARLALVPCPSLAPALPSIVQADCAETAAALLDAGAADVVLAVDPDALVAARLAVLARGGRGAIVVGDVAIDPLARRVTRSGQAVPLLPREYALLLMLARAGGTAVPVEMLRRGLSGGACSAEGNVVAVHVSRLRARLGAGRTAVVTDRGRGYRLVADAGPGA